ncbi:MAG TPA: ATP synthase F0 subunit B [Polyangia bacterium]|nr:ATP synthase F0 subunit B [Polyangia bacterium]
MKLLRLIAQLAAVVCALALPALAFAQEEHAAPAGEGHDAAGEHGEGAGEHGEAHEPAHEPSIDGKRLAFQVLNFGVLVFLLVKFGGPAVSKALLARHQQIKSDLASAAEVRAAAEARFEKQEKRLASLEHEIAAITASIKQEAEAEKVRLIALAEERARRIREESEFIIEQQIKQAEEDLRREVAAAAVALAEKIVRSQLGPGDQQRMIDAFVGDIATPNGARPNGTPHSGSAAPAGRGAPRSEI